MQKPEQTLSLYLYSDQVQMRFFFGNALRTFSNRRWVLGFESRGVGLAERNISQVGETCFFQQKFKQTKRSKKKTKLQLRAKLNENCSGYNSESSGRLVF